MAAFSGSLPIASPLAGSACGDRFRPSPGGGSSVSRKGGGGPAFSLAGGSVSANVSLRDEHVQDGLFAIIVDALGAMFRLNCLAQMAPTLVREYEDLLTEHFCDSENSQLRRTVPSVKPFFTPLPFAAAFDVYNRKYRITNRRFVPPTFHEIRHIMNIAQVMAVRHSLRLVTFDGDETLYADGRNFSDATLAQRITALLRRGIHVAVVTAAGYGYQAEKYEVRLKGLLQHWRDTREPADVVRRFLLFGGETNYLLRCRADYRLRGVPERFWRPFLSERLKYHLTQLEADEERSEIRRLLDTAEAAFRAARAELSLRCAIVRKARAVGIVPGGEEGRAQFPVGSGTAALRPEILEEVCFRVRHALASAAPPLAVPFCAFNGGSDAWVDVGNKAEAVRALRAFLDIQGEGGSSLHVGDQFLPHGNDLAARDAGPTLWICSPAETKAVLRSLLRQLDGAGREAGAAALPPALDALSDTRSEAASAAGGDDPPPGAAGAANGGDVLDSDAEEDGAEIHEMEIAEGEAIDRVAADAEEEADRESASQKLASEPASAKAG